MTLAAGWLDSMKQDGSEFIFIQNPKLQSCNFGILHFDSFPANNFDSFPAKVAESSNAPTSLKLVSASSLKKKNPVAPTATIAEEIFNAAAPLSSDMGASALGASLATGPKASG
ncbi:Uncharacterized protein Fot_04902 [Forsythia ovata]|uniref:Uncharacterized protein n=1 Tax=Forsythia ovata TaxID=205694 RepID=A0ABD1WRH4_9LAMI